MSELDPVLRQILVGHEAETDHSGPAAVARRQALMAMQQAGALRSAAEQCAAASVLVCSEVTAEVQAAQALALAAMPALARARLLAATAYDRLRRLAGEPQKFGTQIVTRDGVLELWPIDASTTDSERAKWGVLPLAEILRGLGKQ